jgi:hypothetical protein
MRSRVGSASVWSASTCIAIHMYHSAYIIGKTEQELPVNRLELDRIYLYCWSSNIGLHGGSNAQLANLRKDAPDFRGDGLQINRFPAPLDLSRQNSLDNL